MTAFNHNINIFMCLMMSFEKKKMLRIKQILIPYTLSSHYQMKKKMWTLCAYITDSNLH